MQKHDCIFVGIGPAGLGAAFLLTDKNPDLSILMIDKSKTSTGGMQRL